MSTKDYVEKDYYKALGVPKDASTDEIRKAYRGLARKFHPDARPGDKKAEERFKEISEAYDVLSDDKRRKDYDEARTLFGSGGFRFPGGRPGAGGRPGGPGVDLGDLFGAGTGAGGLGDILGGIFGGGGTTRTRTAQPRRGADVESEVTLGFRDAVDGATVPLRMTSPGPCPTCQGTGAAAGTMPRTCPVCQGSGQTSRNEGGFALSEPCRECRGRGLIVDNPCPTCHGSGRGTTSKTMQVRIPAGVQDGQRIRLKGKGAPGERGGPSGDLIVVVHVHGHSLFGRRGDNLTLTVPVTVAEAALGGEIKVPTLDGSQVTLRLPAGSSNGRTMRVRGKGSLRPDGSRADLLVTIEVVVPQKLNDKARKAMESFAAATADEDPRAGLTQRAQEG